MALGITVKVRLQPPNAQDVLHLISVRSFMSLVDSWDLSQRNSEAIVDAYHIHWFEIDEDGIHRFHAPEFYLTKGLAGFIDGRHRTLLLSKYLEAIPMALTNMDELPIYSG